MRDIHYRLPGVIGLADHYPAEARIWRTVTAAFFEHLQPKSRAMFDGDFYVGAMAASSDRLRQGASNGPACTIGGNR